jgi:choline dehydrogenase-like flavoprotein
MPALPLRVHEVLIKNACTSLGIPAIPGRKAMITRPHNGRAACHYCAQCGHGCVTASAYSSSQVQIFPAMKTGKLQIVTGAMARELIVGKDGRVKAVSYIDKQSREEKSVACRVVVVAASTCETARLLLNSKSSLFPQGIANSSGVIGRNLTDSVSIGVHGQIPALEDLMRYNSDGIRGFHLYIPWWLYDKKTNFPRGYHVELGGGFGMPAVGMLRTHSGFGKALKARNRHNYGSSVGFTGRGEMVPNGKSYCEIDPDVTDEYGIPVLRFHFQWSDYERKQAEHMRQTFTSIIEAMHGRPESIRATTMSIGGEIIHETGTVRMGNDRATSALNKYGQAHDVKNLFVADAAPFVSNPDKNPTLTIVALAWRLSEYLAEEMRKGNV